jgi:hypothetical protein
MDTICYLQVPDNFEERYGKYRGALEDEPHETASQGAEEPLLPAQARSSNTSEDADIKGSEKQEGGIAVKLSIILKGNWPSFGQKGDIKIGENSCHIADAGDLQYHICKELLTEGGRYKFGDFVSQTALQDRYVPFGVVVEEAGAGGSASDSFKSERWLKDAVRLITGKTVAAFGAELFEYKLSQVRLKIELFK